MKIPINKKYTKKQLITLFLVYLLSIVIYIWIKKKEMFFRETGEYFLLNFFLISFVDFFIFGFLPILFN